MVIDSHQHAFWHGRDDAGLIADMDRNGIDLAWLLTWEIPPNKDNAYYHRVLNPVHCRPDGTHAGIPLADLLAAQRRFPGRFVLGYCPCPYWDNAPDLFESACALHGVRVCGEWKHRIPFDAPRCLNLFRKAGELGCPVVLHLDVPYRMDPKTGRMAYQRDWYGGTVAHVERALQACSETRFLGHGPGFWREISGDADAEPSAYPKGPVAPGGRLTTLFARYPNLYGDLSAGSGVGALRRDPNHAGEFLARFADRMLFARDDYGNELQTFLATLNLTGEIKERLFWRNAATLVPVRAPGEGRPSK